MSVESSICHGCYLNPGLVPPRERCCDPLGRYDDPFYNGYFPLLPNNGLTTAELKILQHTKDIWDEFASLTDKVDYDDREMQDAIHRVQQLIALRVARRVDTMVWRQANE